jgi:hypothetical protein
MSPSHGRDDAADLSLEASLWKRMTLPMTPNESTKARGLDLTALLQLDDDEFVQSAYLTILEREADPSGHRHYLERVREGSSKLEILCDLYASDEARAKGIELAWMGVPMRRRKLSRLPLVGVLYRASAKERRLQILEQSVSSLRRQYESLEHETHRLEKNLAELAQHGNLLSPAVNTANHLDADLVGASASARRIYQSLQGAGGRNGL